MRILSGGQTGVDRAALDVALALGLPCGGWCPAGRWAEDGPIPTRYPLRQTPLRDPAQRTWWNVRDSDATLVLVRGGIRGGTALTVQIARWLDRPYRVLSLTDAPNQQRVRAWLLDLAVGSLNVAGPRESEVPGVYRQAHAYLWRLLAVGSWRRALTADGQRPG